MNKTNISWCDATINFLSGCTKCSPACAHCYAERMHTKRHKAYYAGKKMPQQYAKPFSEIQFHPERLAQITPKQMPQRIFVNSMSDTFHPGVREEWLCQMFDAMALCPQHTFLILTKRPDRMRKFVGSPPHGPWPNLWLGATAWDQPSLEEACENLFAIPAAHRFISLEPLLGPVSFRWAKWDKTCFKRPVSDHLDGVRGLDLIIVGGETGPGARPMHPDWVRDIRDQCQEAGVPFHFKQWGEWAPREYVPFDANSKVMTHSVPLQGDDANWRYLEWGRNNYAPMLRVGRVKAGHLLDGKEWREMP